MKNGPAMPGWATALLLGVVVVALIGFGYKYIMGSGPLPESQYPKEAFTPPGYGNPAAHGGGSTPSSGVSGYGGTTMTPEQAAQRGR